MPAFAYQKRPRRPGLGRDATGERRLLQAKRTSVSRVTNLQSLAKRSHRPEASRTTAPAFPRRKGGLGNRLPVTSRRGASTRGPQCRTRRKTADPTEDPTASGRTTPKASRRATFRRRQPNKARHPPGTAQSGSQGSAPSGQTETGSKQVTARPEADQTAKENTKYRTASSAHRRRTYERQKRASGQSATEPLPSDVLEDILQTGKPNLARTGIRSPASREKDGRRASVVEGGTNAAHGRPRSRRSWGSRRRPARRPSQTK